MFLAIDIGNTTTAIGKFNHHQLVGIEKNTTDKLVDSSNIQQLLMVTAAKATLEGIAICSVVPKLTPLFVEAVPKAFAVEPWIFDNTAKLDMKILYDDPTQLGADRLANAYALREFYGAPAIAVDLGTATKFDVVNRQGEYAGGAIAPGVMTSAKSLFSYGARLFEVKIEPPPKYIATNTVEAMQSGIFYGAIGQIDYLITQIKAEMGEQDAKVIATGGFAELIAPHSKQIQQIDLGLTLRGIRLGWERK
jgi:type III pantothenate kinase